MDLATEVALQGGVVEILCPNDWVDLRVMRLHSMGISGYVFAHEAHGRGHGVAILPFRERPFREREILLRVEVVPPWGLDPVPCAITGSWDHVGEDFASTASRELHEEGGYRVPSDQLISLGTCRGTKGLDTQYYLYGADVTGRERGLTSGDGSQIEAEATAEWFSGTPVGCPDPLVSAMYLRLVARNWR